MIVAFAGFLMAVFCGRHFGQILHVVRLDSLLKHVLFSSQVHVMFMHIGAA